MFMQNGLRPIEGAHKSGSSAVAAIAVIAMIFIPTSAIAQQAAQEELPPGLVVEVTPQGWLDPPNVPIEGALQGTVRQQVIIDTYITRDSAFIARPDSFGKSVLPRGRGPNINLRTID